MKVYQALANAFYAEGVTAVFGMMGGANASWMKYMNELGATVHHVRHEGAGLAMADGWARMTGTPGVVTTTGGPGIAQLATAMIVAGRANTPLVAFCGDVPFGDDDAAQHLDQARFAAAVEAGFVRLTSADTVYEKVQRAFHQARTESRPVILSMPEDLRNHDVDDADEYVPSTALLTANPPYPNPASIAEAVDLIAGSEKPVIIVGRGAILAGAGEEIRRLADRTGAVIATSLIAKNWLNDHPYHAGVSGLFSTRTGMELFGESDCVIAIGASMNLYTTEHGYLYPSAKVIQIDAKRSVVMGDGRTADCYISSDAKLGTQVLDAALAERGVTLTGYHTDEVRDRLEHALDDPQEYEFGAGLVDPREAVRVLDEEIPGDIGLVLGGGQQNHFGIMLARRPRSWILPNLHFACIGQGMPTAIGGVIAENTPAFLLEGDAGFLMHLADFETAVRYAVPLLVVVMNDEGMAAEYHSMLTKDIDLSMTSIPTPDLGAVGVTLGGRGALCRSVEELRQAAKEFVASPGPMIIDLRIAQVVASIPNRRRFYGQEA
ncbi:MAG TPA: thiamine pyrophosphate-binding protein [Mycobacteriales bacterium]|jgi:thiamine pyrophosphate-dependent acetolactate synthase large subunit-like protein|nr:thiamine pyrophosphate-binding protein [Mycobacteriales bacterium]